MVQLARGERGAADDVFRLLWPALKSFAAKWLDGSPQAEDMAQQALLKVFAQAADFEAGRDALTWALEVTVWECRSERQRLRRGRADGWNDAAERVPAGGSPEKDAEARQLEAALASAVAELPESDRAEVARILEEQAAGDAAARKRRQRAVERLRAVWRKLHGDA